MGVKLNNHEITIKYKSDHKALKVFSMYTVELWFSHSNWEQKKVVVIEVVTKSNKALLSKAVSRPNVTTD